MVLAAAVDCAKESAGVVEAFNTLVVNKGARFPELRLVTVPLPAPPPLDDPAHAFVLLL
jgi:hypothetical protein